MRARRVCRSCWGRGCLDCSGKGSISYEITPPTDAFLPMGEECPFPTAEELRKSTAENPYAKKLKRDYKNLMRRMRDYE